MGEMVKGNLLQVVPMLAIGSWINYAFAGFLCAKLPFPLTFRFKPMLQRGMESLVSLDPSWCAFSHFFVTIRIIFKYNICFTSNTASYSTVAFLLACIQSWNQNCLQ